MSSFPDGSFDVSVAVDVVGRVDDDVALLGHLLRAARRAVFLSAGRGYGASRLAALLGSTGLPFESWRSDGASLPWRVPALGPDEAEHGAWIWKSRPLRHRNEPRVDYWNGLTAEPPFLDRGNPTREEAARIVGIEAAAMGGVCSMVEVGPGPGFDHRDFFSRLPGVSYRAYEISTALRSLFLKAAPTADVRLGSFLDLEPGSADIAYTKSTLEHQRDFRDSMRRLIDAARHLAIINWYLPPSEKQLLRLGPDGIYYNVYARSDVIDFLHGMGFWPEIRTKPPAGNELWLIRKDG